MVDPSLFFTGLSLRAVHSVTREVSRVLPRIVLRRRLLQFALVRSLQGKKWETAARVEGFLREADGDAW